MQAWEAVQETLDYMEERHKEELIIEQLSAIAHLSRFYYQRLLHRLTGYTVSEHLHSIRLKMAAELLKTDSGRIMDIAVQYGLSSHSTLTRAFRQCYGVSPAEYRASSNIHLDHVIKPELCMQCTLVGEGVPLIYDDMALKIQRKVQKEPLQFSGYTKEDESAKIARPKKNMLVVPQDHLEQGDVLQYAVLDEGNNIPMPSQAPGAFIYVAAVHTTEPVKGYTAFEMPMGTYAVYEYEAKSFEDLVQKTLYKASAYLFEIWLPRYGYTCDVFLIRHYIRPKQEDCRLQLWVKTSDSLAL